MIIIHKEGKTVPRQNRRKLSKKPAGKTRRSRRKGDPDCTKKMSEIILLISNLSRPDSSAQIGEIVSKIAQPLA